MSRKVIRLGPDDAKPTPQFAKVVTMGNVCEITGYLKEPKPPPVKPLSADSYVYTEGPKEGLVCDYQRAETKLDSAQSVSRTFAKIRALINTNVTEARNVRWVTLTYAENMTDAKRLYEDFHSFWKRFLYWNQKQGYAKPEYISVVEPQGRGAWHVHALFIWPVEAPYIDNNSVLWPMWGFGYTSIKALRGDVDNVGAYLTAYLADLPLQGDEESGGMESLSDAEKIKALEKGCDVMEKTYTDAQGKRVTKRILKGARLALYPPGMNLYRTSRGIKRPDIEKGLTYADAKKKVSAATLTFARAFKVIDDDKPSKAINVISKEYYNSKRRKSQ